jgi:UDP-N-acetyl-D-mannosaminuronic acid dehydrogenase
MSLTLLREKIQNKTARLAVIGLGYVGLPVAAMFADAGFCVTGVDLKTDRVEKINSGLSPIEGEEPGLTELLTRVAASQRLQAVTEYATLAECDIILIDVETPVDDHHIPRYGALRSALQSLGPVLKPGALVIVESTIAPGTMLGVVQPLLEESSGKPVNLGFYLGNCPERVMPGKLLANLRGLSRVLGGGSPETAEVMVELYRHVVQADLDAVDWITAELVKTVENAYRDVQIAFANEVALICEALGGDVWKVRQLVNKSPYRQMHLPGGGVGGHCIPKDPWLLVYGVNGKDVPLRLIPSARAVNDFMPTHMADLTRQALAKHDAPLNGARILVMGYAYLEDSDDTRNSPSEALVHALISAGAEVVIHDPYVPEYQGDLLAMARGCHAAVIMVKHSAYRNLQLRQLANQLALPILVDGRQVYTPEIASASGLEYSCVGAN